MQHLHLLPIETTKVLQKISVTAHNLNFINENNKDINLNISSESRNFNLVMNSFLNSRGQIINIFPDNYIVVTDFYRVIPS